MAAIVMIISLNSNNKNNNIINNNYTGLQLGVFRDTAFVMDVWPVPTSGAGILGAHSECPQWS